MKIKYSIILLASMFFVSCEKSLDLAPLDTLSEAVYFKTADDFATFTNQFYFKLPDISSGDDHSDISMATGFSSVSNSSYAPTEQDGTWNDQYAVIWQTCYLLDKVAGAPDELKDAIAVYGAEAHFFRAFAHFNLMAYFGGVPIVNKTLGVSSEDILFGPRNTRQEVTDFILNELDQAIAVLPMVDNIADGGRITKGAALALKARVALFEAAWRKYHMNGEGANALFDKAVDACTQIMNSGLYELFDRRDALGDESYRYYFLLESTRQSNVANLKKSDQKETILAKRHDRDIYSAGGLNMGQSVLSPTRKLVDMFLCKDGLPVNKSPMFQGYTQISSEYENRDPRMTLFLLTPFQKYWLYTQPAYQKDWTNPTAGGIVFDIAFGILTQTGYSTQKMQQEMSSPLGNDYPVFRLAEIYLIYAEAMFEKNGQISDADLDMSINKLRDRVGMPHLTNTFVTANGLNMLDEIRRERTIELFVENFRYDDLRRWKIAETEMSQSVRGIKWKGTEFETTAPWKDLVFSLDADGFIILEDASKRKFEQKHYLRPLPLRQLLLNKNLDQNPGWE